MEKNVWKPVGSCKRRVEHNDHKQPGTEKLQGLKEPEQTKVNFSFRSSDLVKRRLNINLDALSARLHVDLLLNSAVLTITDWLPMPAFQSYLKYPPNYDT